MTFTFGGKYYEKNRQFSLMIILLTFSLLVIFSVSTYADEDNYKCGANLTWSISNNVLTIKGKGPIYDFDEPGFGDNFPGWRKEQRHIKRVVIKNGVTTILLIYVIQTDLDIYEMVANHTIIPVDL